MVSYVYVLFSYFISCYYISLFVIPYYTSLKSYPKHTLCLRSVMFCSDGPGKPLGLLSSVGRCHPAGVSGRRTLICLACVAPEGPARGALRFIHGLHSCDLSCRGAAGVFRCSGLLVCLFCLGGRCLFSLLCFVLT